jgi:membrane dipeptidase
MNKKDKWLEFLRAVPSVDLHCDILSSIKNGAKLLERRSKGHWDLPRIKEGGLWGEVLSLFVHPKWYSGDDRWKAVIKFISRLDNALQLSDELSLVTTPEMLVKNAKDGKRSIILEIEGLHPIEEKPNLFDELWKLGIRIFTLTWNNSNRFATSSMNETDDGLKIDGRALIKEITNRKGIIDLSHSSDKTFYDVIDMGVSPILSHSAVRELKKSSRNIDSKMISSLSEAKGVMGVNFFPGFLSTKSYSEVDSYVLVDHIEHIINFGSIELPALGSDFDGVKALPKDILDASGFWIIAESLSNRGFDNDSISGLMGRNFLNYWKRIQK